MTDHTPSGLPQPQTESRVIEAGEQFVRGLGLGFWPDHRQCYEMGYRDALSDPAVETVAGKEAPKDWAKIEAFTDEFVSDYEMRGESEDGRDACYTPNDNDRALLRDCIAGLLAESEFLAMLAAPAVEPKGGNPSSLESGQLACGTLGARVAAFRRLGASVAPRAEPTKVFLVCTGEVYEGQETYTRHEGAPPPMSDFETLYATPQADSAQPVVATDAEKRQLIGNYFAEAWAKEAAWNMLDDYDRRADHG